MELWAILFWVFLGVFIGIKLAINWNNTDEENGFEKAETEKWLEFSERLDKLEKGTKK